MRTALNRPACLLAVLLALAPHVQAEKADRALPMVVEADKPGSMDMQKQVVIFNGNVVLTQGTTTLRAERVEVRETKDGQRSGVATGTSSRRASYREKRDALDEFVEGEGERIEFDTRSDTLRFVGNAVVRRLRGTELVDEITELAALGVDWVALSVPGRTRAEVRDRAGELADRLGLRAEIGSA